MAVWRRISRFLTEKLDTLWGRRASGEVVRGRGEDRADPICLTLPACVSRSFSIWAHVSVKVGDSPNAVILPVEKSIDCARGR